MQREFEKVIQEFTAKILELLGDRLKKVILYGSYARGDYTKNSDIDIMILTDFSDEEIVKYRNQIREIACDVEMENDIVISPLLKNIDKYNERTNVIPFYYNVQKEGVILHG